MVTNQLAIRGKMSSEELEMVFSMAVKEDVEIALREYEIMEYRKIVRKLLSDNYNALRMATELHDNWEDVASMIESNHSLKFREKAELISYIVKSLMSELYSLGYSRHWVRDFLNL